MLLTHYHGAPAYALGLVLTLVLASFLTPAHWWRRPTARGLAVLGGGTWAIGALLLMLSSAAVAPTLPVDVPAQHLVAMAPDAGQRYRVHRDLNVRSGAGVRAARQAVVPAGEIVTFTGIHEGDWWQIRYDSGAGSRSGWASSLWLRRTSE
jgi:hypothetical protein